MSRTQDRAPPVCSNIYTMEAISQTQDLTDTRGSNLTAVENTQMEGDQRHQLAVLACVVFCSE